MKLQYLILPTIMVFLAACGGKKNSTPVVDTPFTSDTTLPPVDTTAVDADSIPEYYSADLRKFGLHGMVKSVRTRDYGNFVTCLSGPLSFSPDGVLLSKFPDLLDNEISENLKGFIDETECHEADGTSFELEFTNWDEENNPISGKYTSDGPDSVWEVTFTITYLQYDRENNWIARHIKGEAVTRDKNSSGEIVSSQSEPFSSTETRSISYYK